ncbi:MAG: hypothetical protein NTU44_01690 [Bacteroidetes bacterium]|nr:hypothetical protein [Bacteroidota bacterium]
MKQIYSLLCLIACWGLMEGTMAAPGDTTVVGTFRFDSSMRSGVFMFPNDPGKTYEKILMLYSMRCKNGLVSTSANTNLGCGEWDYNCYTYVVDSSQTDSLRQTHSNYDISQFSGGSFAFTYDSVYTYTLFEQQSVTYGNVIGENTGSVGNDVFPSDHPLGSADAIARTQYLWTAAELTAAELTTGDITALRMELQSTGNMLNNLRIRIKTTQQTYLDPYAPELDGFTEVYFLNTSFLTTGLQQFNFYNPFTWDGSSNLLVEFSYQNISPGVDNIQIPRSGL